MATPRHRAAMVVEGLEAPHVWLVQTLRDGTERRRRLPDWLAAEEALRGPDNGRTVVRARIEFGAVLDRYGISGGCPDFRAGRPPLAWPLETPPCVN